MMSDTHNNIFSFQKSKDFLICVDSDGCVFDAMEIKHKECFAPNFIRYWNLQAVSKYAREVWEFVNLYSESRGCNRFQAVIKALDLLAERSEAVARGYKKPDLTSLRKWVNTEKVLDNPFLERAVVQSDDPVLRRTLEWSQGVNRSVADIVRGVPPFPSVRSAFDTASKAADLLVVSATPSEALIREWNEHDLAKHVIAIAGQEAGTKANHIALAKDGRYDDSHVLKIGDALGDYHAAKANQVKFFPIRPGHEEDSWQQFISDGLTRLISGTYSEDYEEKLVHSFRECLPTRPPWKV